MKKINEELMLDIAGYMDDDIREKLHCELAPCTNEKFLVGYCKIKEDFSDFLYKTFSIDVDMLTGLDGGIAYKVTCSLNIDKENIAELVHAYDDLDTAIEASQDFIGNPDEGVAFVEKIHFDSTGSFDPLRSEVFKVSQMGCMGCKVDILEQRRLPDKIVWDWRTLTKDEIDDEHDFRS